MKKFYIVTLLLLTSSTILFGMEKEKESGKNYLSKYNTLSSNTVPLGEKEKEPENIPTSIETGSFSNIYLGSSFTFFGNLIANDNPIVLAFKGITKNKNEDSIELGSLKQLFNLTPKNQTNSITSWLFFKPVCAVSLLCNLGLAAGIGYWWLKFKKNQ